MIIKIPKKIYSINLIKNNFRKINLKLVIIYNFRNEDNKQIDKGNIEMYLIRFDKVKEIEYSLNEKRFIIWLRIINAESLEEIQKYSKGDEIMSEADKFIAEWCLEKVVEIILNNTWLKNHQKPKLKAKKKEY